MTNSLPIYFRKVSLPMMIDPVTGYTCPKIMYNIRESSPELDMDPCEVNIRIKEANIPKEYFTVR